MFHFRHHDSPVGTLLLATDANAVREIHFPKRGRTVKPQSDWVPGDGGGPAAKLLDRLQRELDAYFEKTLRRFRVPVKPEGTVFQESVWAELYRVPYGETISYGELARRIGKPSASRAVGAANGKNPIPIIIPCHRIIGADGSLTGFGGGLTTKERLLELEGCFIVG